MLGRLRVTPARRTAFFVVVDVALIAAAIFGALHLRLEGRVPDVLWPAAAFLAAIASVSTIGALAIYGVYRISWSFVSLRDVAKVAFAVVASTAFLAVTIQFWSRHGLFLGFPRSVVLIQAPLAFCLLAGFRLSKRAFLLLAHRSRGGVSTLIVGAGSAGEQVLKSIQGQGAKAQYRVVGFIDDDTLAHGTQIHGVPVLGGLSELEAFVKTYSVGTIIVCVATASSDFVRDIVRRGRESGVRKVRIIPPLSQIVEGEVTVNATRDVSLEDLLGREPVKIDQRDVRGCLEGRRVLVTGGAGTIGSELCRQIARFQPSRLIVLDVDETRLHEIALELRHAQPDLDVRQALADVRSTDALGDLFGRERPDVVFHAAAYKHVPMMEMWPLAALEVNVVGTANVLDAAEAHGCSRFILISTDKAVEPSSVMGASKRLAELLVFARHPSATVRSAVRFGNVIGSRGSVIPTFERQLAQGGPLTVTHPDIERFFMMTSEAVSLVLQSAALGEGNDAFVLDMGKPVRILEVAREFIRLKGLEPDEDVPIVFTGLRPGEKLYELLSYPDEHLGRTRHARLMRAHIPDEQDRLSILGPVQDILRRRDPQAARDHLQARFPTLGAAGRYEDAPGAAVATRA